MTTLSYARSGTGHGTQVVLAVPNEHPANSAKEIPPDTRISTEFLKLTERYFDDLGIRVKVVWSYGATEAKVPEIVDAIVDVTETGNTLRAHGMKIIETLLTSEPVLIANREAMRDEPKRAAIEDIKTLLLGALRAEGRVLIKLNVSEDRLQPVLAVVPVHEGADGVPALRGRLRDRGRRGQAGREQADPGPESGRRHRHPRDAHLQDRAMTTRALTGRLPK